MTGLEGVTRDAFFERDANKREEAERVLTFDEASHTRVDTGGNNDPVFLVERARRKGTSLRNRKRGSPSVAKHDTGEMETK